jgi:hypothetical protein
MTDVREEEARVGTASKGRRGRIVLVGVAGALLVGGSGLGLALSDAGASAPPGPVTCNGSTPKLTVQGMGQATGVPDLLTAVFQLSTTEPTASAALSGDNTKVSQALLALAANGVARKDVQTTDVTLQPNYSFPAHSAPVITGYQVQNTVTASLHDLKTAGAAIDALVSATGNAAQIQSLSFSFDNPAVVEGQARAAAVHQAVTDAKAMAAAAGRQLGPVCSLTDNTQPNQLVPNGDFTSAGSPAQSASNLSEPVPLESGTQNETDQVTMVYAVRSR